MHNISYKSALARRACRYSDAQPPRKTDGVLLESELPPRMRGKGLNPPRYSGICRITPAYAGKSMPVNPKKDKRVGSPPHMRGKVATGRQTVCRCGITPAYAGKRGLRKRGSRNPADHPRICGEKAEMGGFIPRFSGSPPRMRGKVLPDRGRVLGVGITPAYAGKSFPTSMFRSVGRDHPRICGEKIVVSRTWCSRSGLPPRMWGKVSSIRDDLARVGITPAYAGKSSSPRLIALLIWDHPRVCGEKFRAYAKIWNEWGSPPRMRGKVIPCLLSLNHERITPAYAGKRI